MALAMYNTPTQQSVVVAGLKTDTLVGDAPWSHIDCETTTQHQRKRRAYPNELEKSPLAQSDRLGREAKGNRRKWNALPKVSSTCYHGDMHIQNKKTR